MKKFFTIFLTWTLAISLWGQTKVPMYITGNVRVNADGAMRSDGMVHVDTTGRVANYGKLATDSILFHSNDLTSDGLLMNRGNVTAAASTSAPPVKVGARRAFTKNNTWYTMSFPFDVDIDAGAVKNADNGSGLTRGTEYQVQYYDPVERATRGVNDEKNWKTLDAAEKTLKKGVAYHIAVIFSKLGTPGTGGRHDLDFFAINNNPNIADLFAYKEKGFDLTFAYDKEPGGPKFVDGRSDGWNAIGGLNTSDFFIADSTVKFNETTDNKIVYGWTGTRWKAINLSINDNDNKGTLRPYASFFVQTAADPDDYTKSISILTLAAGGGFVFHSNGVTLGAPSNFHLFRSLQSDSRDILGLWLTDASDNAKRSNIYFIFRDGFSKFYRSSEDGIQVDTQSNVEPIIWSIAQSESNAANNTAMLFTNSLPKGENEVPVGVNIPATGKYVFSMNEIANETIKSAVLWDKVTNSKTDLLKGDYSFQSNGSINRSDRFVIFFNVITSIDPLPKVSFYAYADKNVLTVKNLLPGDTVQVFDITGHIIVSGVASGDTFSAPLNQKGVYIVNVKGETLKVLNK